MSPQNTPLTDSFVEQLLTREDLTIEEKFKLLVKHADRLERSLNYAEETIENAKQSLNR